MMKLFRPLIGVALLAGIGVFGFFYLSGKPSDEPKERAKKALSQTGETVVEQGLVAAVNIRLAADFGVSTERFLHVYNDNGKIVVYGLLPPELKDEQVAAVVKQVPGVKSVEVLVLPRPAHVAPPSEPKAPEGK